MVGLEFSMFEIHSCTLMFTYYLGIRDHSASYSKEYLATFEDCMSQKLL